MDSRNCASDEQVRESGYSGRRHASVKEGEVSNMNMTGINARGLIDTESELGCGRIVLNGMIIKENGMRGI